MTGVVQASSVVGDNGVMTEPHSPRSGPHRAIVVVGPDGRPIGTVPAGGGGSSGAGGGGAGGGEGPGDQPEDTARADAEAGMAPTDLVEQPAKVLRIGTMVKQLLDEVRAAPLDDASRVRLREIHESSIRELCTGLAPELCAELHRLSLPFTDDAVPSDAELRIAQAQLVGWLEGLFHGIQTALVAQQMAARAQLEEMRRRALPGGLVQPGSGAPGDGSPSPAPGFARPGSGPYL